MAALCFLFAVAVVFAGTPAPLKPPVAKDGQKNKCLSCHPWDKLTETGPGFPAPDGVIIKPHVYVPHNQKETGSIPECLNCHVPHPVPLKSKTDRQKANVIWCISCHHTGEMKACNACHSG